MKNDRAKDTMKTEGSKKVSERSQNTNTRHINQIIIFIKCDGGWDATVYLSWSAGTNGSCMDNAFKKKKKG